MRPECSSETERMMKLPDMADAAAELLYGNNPGEALKDIGTIIREINDIYLGYINREKEYAQKGVDIPVQILLSQMQNLIDAVDNGDVIMLADTLRYEIREGLLFFNEIEKEM